MAARVVASDLSVSAKYRPEINYDNKYLYINYSRAAVVSYIRVYHQQRDLFHVVALFLQPKRSIAGRTRRFTQISRPNTNISPYT